MFFQWEEIPSGGILLGESSHIPHEKFLLEEEWKEDFSNPTMNLEARG
jgi:hypothetical protein